MAGAFAENEINFKLHRGAVLPGESGLLGNGLLARFETMTIDGRAGRLIPGVIRVSK
jgi:hypothetical protein